MLIVLVLLICAFMHDVLPLSVSSVDKGDEFLMNLQNILSEFSTKSDTGEVRRTPLLERLSGNSYARANLLTMSRVIAA